jgi:hypothetical protein
MHHCVEGAAIDQTMRVVPMVSRVKSGPVGRLTRPVRWHKSFADRDSRRGTSANRQIGSGHRRSPGYRRCSFARTLEHPICRLESDAKRESCSIKSLWRLASRLLSPDSSRLDPTRRGARGREAVLSSLWIGRLVMIPFEFDRSGEPQKKGLAHRHHRLVPRSRVDSTNFSHEPHR